MKILENLSIALTAALVGIKTARDLKKSVRNGVLPAATPTTGNTEAPNSSEMTRYWIERPSQSLEELLRGVKTLGNMTPLDKISVMGPIFDTRTALRAQYGSALEADSGGGRRAQTWR